MYCTTPLGSETANNMRNANPMLDNTPCILRMKEFNPEWSSDAEDTS